MNKLENIGNLYPHNKKVFKELLENLKTNDRVAIVQATGTGKGKLASCIVEYTLFKNKDAKILIFAPLNSILENYKECFNLTSENVIYKTYKSLSDCSDSELVKIGKYYDIIILDEFHRLGGPYWNIKTNKLFEYKKLENKIIGLTATPIRYLDDERDMANELFGGNIINGITLEEAIIDGILPRFEYNICYYKPEEKIKEIRSKIVQNNKLNREKKEEIVNRVDKITLSLENNIQIRKMIKSQTKRFGENQKWAIFCKDLDDLKEIEESCSEWFLFKPNIFILNSYLGRKYNAEVLSNFRKIKSGINILLSVNMLNEGVHIKDLNGVIMLRKTDSPILFLQQLGRSLETGKKFKPIIFDLVGNINGLKDLGIIKNIVQNINNCISKNSEKNNYIIINNYLEEIDKILEELNLYTCFAVWTQEEDKILIDNYVLKGVEYCCSLLPNRTEQAIIVRARSLGLYSGIYWTPEEDKVLIDNYASKGLNYCLKNLPNRTEGGIRHRIGVLGIKPTTRSEWSVEEEEFLKENYVKYGAKYCFDNLPNRNLGAIQQKASTLGLSLQPNWSEEEDNILRKYYPKYGAKYCAEKLSHRSFHSVRGRIRSLGLKSESPSANIGVEWTKEEEEILKKYYLKYGLEYCQKFLPNRSTLSIRRKAQHLGVTASKNDYWTEEEDKFLIENYPTKGSVFCFEKLENRTLEAVRGRAKLLNLKTQYIPKAWSEEEIQFLLKNYEKYGPKYCSEHLKNRTHSSVITRAAKLGLKYKRK